MMRIRQRHRCGFAALLMSALAGVAVAQPTTQPAVLDYSGYHKTYTLPISKLNGQPVDFDKLGGMNVRVSINGGPPLLLQVDTGSWGIVVGDQDVPNLDPNAPEGNLLYSSSGNGFHGVWSEATVKFIDAKDENGNVATAVVPVLAAKLYKFTPGAVNSGNRTAPSEKLHPTPRMLGVGSGRGDETNQFRNPFVNLNEMRDGSMRRGYTITREGITLGLAADKVGDGYVYEKLNERKGKPTTWPTGPEPVAKDWDAPTGYAVVGGKKFDHFGMLLDTGLTNFMIEYPEITTQKTVPNGTPVEVFLQGGKLKYGFTVGDKTDPDAPPKVTEVHYENMRLINTGLRALANFDYLYDADGGYFGLRPTRKDVPTTYPASRPTYE